MVVLVAPPLVPIPELSIPQFLESNPFSNSADQVIYYRELRPPVAASLFSPDALVPDPESLEQTTWDQYLSMNRQLASGFQKLWGDQLHYGDVVSILSPNDVGSINQAPHIS